MQSRSQLHEGTRDSHEATQLYAMLGSLFALAATFAGYLLMIQS
jgi:hypothetical protein